mgnify:CR=1 FL=1
MYPTDAATDAAIDAGKIKTADLVDMYLKTSGGSTLNLRAWSWPGTASFPGTLDLDGSTSNNSYESMFGRMIIAKTIRQAASLGSEPLDIQFDASRSGDDEDFVGRFVDAKWHQARIRVRQVLLDWTTEALASAPMWEWRGLLDHRELVEPPLDTPDQPRVWNVSCQGGLFRVRGRRLSTRSDADQQRRSPGDRFYSETAKMVGRPLNWSKAPGNIPGKATGSGSSATGGSSGSSGGSTGIIAGVGKYGSRV